LIEGRATMRGRLRQRITQVSFGLAATSLLAALGMGLLYWLLVPEISLSAFIDRIRPYLPLRYEALALRAWSA
jgi:hypothetical protein